MKLWHANTTSLRFLPSGCSHFFLNSCWTFTHYPSLHYIKQLALFSQYGEVRKVEPPAVGPKESVRYGWGRFSPRYSANGWARDAAVCRIHWTAASVMFQSLVITLFVDVSPTRSVTGRPSCLSRNGTSLVHASTRLLNRQVFIEILCNHKCTRKCSNTFCIHMYCFIIF